MDPQVYREIALSQFIGWVKSYHEEGWRFANLCGSTVGDKVELLCSFSKGDELENLAVLVAQGEQVPAISSLYPSAFFFENETRDLFGIQFKGTILDYGGSFYPTSVPTPMNPGSVEAEGYVAFATDAEDSEEAGASAGEDADVAASADASAEANENITKDTGGEE